MKTIRIFILLIILGSLYSFRLLDNPYPPFVVHVHAYNSGCATNQANVSVYFSWNGGSYLCSTDETGSCGTGVPPGVSVSGTASYNGHTGTFCNVIQTEGGVTVTVCINDANCCVPDYRYFGYNFEMDKY